MERRSEGLYNWVKLECHTLIESYKVLQYLETALALNDDERIELELTRDEVSFLISVLEDENI